MGKTPLLGPKLNPASAGLFIMHASAVQRPRMSSGRMERLLPFVCCALVVPASAGAACSSSHADDSTSEGCFGWCTAAYRDDHCTDALQVQGLPVLPG